MRYMPRIQSHDIRSQLRRWRTRKLMVDRDRDRLVRTALQEDVSREDIHILMGVGRTTIDRIVKGKGPPV